jgi:hypothetical protein
MLRHPFYAGAYVFGRCVVDRVGRAAGKSGRRSARPDEWILLRDRVPAYITWEQFEENRRRMAENDKGRGADKRAVRAGTLLNRLARCGVCGGPMPACNTHEVREPRYACNPGHHDPGPACQSVLALAVDRLIEALVLDAVRPAGLELSLRAADQAGRDRDRLHAAWRQKVERARYEADRARRQYDAAEPENRLVARELERRWEQALAGLRQVEEDYTRFQAELPREMAAADRARIRALAGDLPALWSSPTTCPADRRAVVRLLIERVELTRRGGTELIDVVVHWRGGGVGRHVARQRVRGYQNLGRYAELRDRVAGLRASGASSTDIAAALNREGFAMPRGEAFNGCAVRRLCRQIQLAGRPAESRDSGGPKAGEWWLPDLAVALGVPRSVLYRWREWGYVIARQRAGDQTQWVVRAGTGEMRRLRRLRAYELAHRGTRPPAELTAPAGRKAQKSTPKTGSPPVRRGGK